MICFKIAKIIIDVNNVNIVYILSKQTKKEEDKNALKRQVLYIKRRCKMGWPWTFQNYGKSKLFF